MVDSPTRRLTYASYLRIPELLELQCPLGSPAVPGEMLFIIGQQAQELWFKQILWDMKRVVTALGAGRRVEGMRMMERINHILRILSEEAEILESLPPVDFRGFRASLQSASGFQSEQFREMELASGLRDDMYDRMVSKLLDVEAVRVRWPVTLHDALCSAVREVNNDVVGGLAAVYGNPDAYPELYVVAEAFSEFEVRFREWRFHHMTVVERVIGDRSPGTGGSSGSGYLGHTLEYRFFPELWEARNRLSVPAKTAGNSL